VELRRNSHAGLPARRAHNVSSHRRPRPQPLEHGVRDSRDCIISCDRLMRRRRWRKWPHKSGNARRRGPECGHYVQRRGRYTEPNAESFDQRRVTNGAGRAARCDWPDACRGQAAGIMAGERADRSPGTQSPCPPSFLCGLCVKSFDVGLISDGSNKLSEPSTPHIPQLLHAPRSRPRKSRNARAPLPSPPDHASPPAWPSWLHSRTS